MDSCSQCTALLPENARGTKGKFQMVESTYDDSIRRDELFNFCDKNCYDKWEKDNPE